MKSRITSVLATVFVLLIWGPNAYAGCTNAQFAGTWDVVFADGNSCRLILNKSGEVLTNPDRSLSTCFDPFRGETAPDWGGYEVDSSCGVGFALGIEDQVVEIYGRIAQPRNVAAGFYLLYPDPDYPPVVEAQEKGAITMIRAD